VVAAAAAAVLLQLLLLLLLLLYNVEIEFFVISGRNPPNEEDL
jgi:hypothetical protein